MDKRMLHDCLNMAIYFKLGETFKSEKSKMKSSNNFTLTKKEKKDIISNFVGYHHSTNLFKQKYDMPNFDYSHFNILLEYDFDDLQGLYLLLNFDYIFDKYGYLIEANEHPTRFYNRGSKSHYEITYDIDENNNGYYNYAISKEGVDFIKKRINSNMDLPIGVHNFICLKNIMLEVDVDSILKKYTNLCLEEVTKLNILCHNNKFFFDKYLDILNSCDIKKRKLILQFIEPFSFQYTKRTATNPYENNQYLEFIENPYGDRHHSGKYEYWLYLLTFIFNYNSPNSIKFNYDFLINSGFFNYNLEYDERIKKHEGQKNLNIFFMKEFEYYFLEQYSVIEKIINLENWKEVLEFFIKIKEELIYNNMPKVTGTITMGNKLDKTRKTYYTTEDEEGNDYGVNYKRPVYDYIFVEVPTIIDNNFNLNIEQTLKIKNSLNYIFNLTNNDINNYNGFIPQNYNEIINLIRCFTSDENEKDNIKIIKKGSIK